MNSYCMRFISKRKRWIWFSETKKHEGTDKCAAWLDTRPVDWNNTMSRRNQTDEMINCRMTCIWSNAPQYIRYSRYHIINMLIFWIILIRKPREEFVSARCFYVILQKDIWVGILKAAQATLQLRLWILGHTDLILGEIRTVVFKCQSSSLFTLINSNETLLIPPIVWYFYYKAFSTHFDYKPFNIGRTR